MRHPCSASRAAQFMFASPSSAKHVRTSSCMKALARMSYTRSFTSLFIFSNSRYCFFLVSRRRNADCAGGKVHFAQKVGQADDQGRHRCREKRAHQPLQLHEHEDFHEKRHDHHADQQRRERAGCDCRACKVTPAVQGAELDLKQFPDVELRGDRVLGELTAAVDDARQAADHDIEKAGDPGEKKDRRQRELYGVSNVADVGCRIEHGCGSLPLPASCLIRNLRRDQFRQEVQASESQYWTILRRIAASGSAPRAASRLSSMYSGLSVPGMTAVTAGCPRMNLRKNCAQVLAPNSAAKSGNGRLPALRNRELRPNGRLTSTAAPASRAAGSSVFSASSAPSE